MRVKLFTYLKNTDLHAISATEAIRSYMKFTDLNCLKRYQVWEFDIDSDASNLDDLIQQIVSDSYYLVNSNKQSYFLNKLPQPKVQNNQEVFLLTVEKKFHQGEHLIEEKITEKTGIQLKNLKQYLLWEIHVKAQHPLEFLKKQVETILGPTESTENGLLVNRFYETYQFVDKELIYH